MTRKARFSKGLNLDNPKTLILAISMDNKKQTLEDFEAFVELANRHKKRISKVRVVLSCYLQRHYVGNDEAIRLYDKWKLENDSFLKKFNISEDEVKPESWKEIMEDYRYPAELEKAWNEYKENQIFKDIIDNLAKKFSWKKSFEDARNYLLDECAGLLVLSYDGIIAYPHHKLNDAADYFLHKYNPEHHYAGYEISTSKTHELTKKSVVNNEEILISSCLNLSKALETNGIFGQDNQSRFFEKFIQLKTEFSAKDKESFYGASQENKEIRPTTSLLQ